MKQNFNMIISKEKLLAAYANGCNGERKMLENLFGVDVFKPNVTERIKTFEDACRELGENHPFVHAYNGYAKNISEENKNNVDVIAYLKLRIICAALNEGWEPLFDKDELRYYPWFTLYTNDEIGKMTKEERDKICRVVGRAYGNAYAYGGLVYAYASNASSFSYTSYGSRLAFKTKELAEYAGTQFIEIYRDFMV